MSGNGRADDDVKFMFILLGLIAVVAVIITCAVLADHVVREPDVPRTPTPTVTQSGGRR